LNVVLEGRAGLDKDAADRHLEVAKEAIDRIVYGEVIALSGSVSAEHGIGQQKRKILAVRVYVQYVYVCQYIHILQMPVVCKTSDYGYTEWYITY
jgi:hypothetical protein